MKKLVLILSMLTLVLSACSDDDSPSVDPFVGSWTLSQSFENGVEYTLDDCDMQDSVVANTNGTVTVTEYYTNDVDVCVQENPFSGTWINQGNGNYAVTFFGITETINITFDGNTMTTVEIDGPDTYTEVYIRN